MEEKKYKATRKLLQLQSFKRRYEQVYDLKVQVI